MMSTTSAKSLFQAIKPKKKGDPLFEDLPLHQKPATRDSLDFDPTPADATNAFLSVERKQIGIGQTVWEPAVGAGDMAAEMVRHGFEVISSDIVDRSYPGTIVKDFFDFSEPLASRLITNPPYNQINARDGHGRWLRHIMNLDLEYCAMLLNWDWIAARQNGMDELHEMYPPSRVYVCCWKIDFRGGGSPPQRNGWYVWDKKWKGETVLRRLFRDVDNKRQQRMVL